MLMLHTTTLTIITLPNSDDWLHLSLSLCLSIIASEMNKNPHLATTLFQEMNFSTEKRSTRDSQKLKALRITTSNEQKRSSSQNTKVTKMDGDWQRTRLIDEWMEKKRISMPPRLDNDLQFVSSSSSHSSSPGFSSSSDCESVQQKRNKDSCVPPLKQKQISTSTVHSPVSTQDQIHCYCSVPIHPVMTSKSKSAAQKMYADLKISKLPISPGGKLTRFFDSLFNGRHGKIKAPNCSSTTEADDFKQKPQMSYTCSSTSSSTRSCLVKNRKKSVKKSVRFYPTSIENSVEIRSRNVEHSPSSICGRKDENLRFSYMDDYRGASEFVVDDTDDTASDTSSELFEIDHIIFAAVSSNSNESCNNELPVFETTNVNCSNRAISNTETLF